MTNYKMIKDKRKRPAWIFLGYSRGSGFEIGAGAPLSLVASVAQSERLDNFRFLALGTFANLAPLVAHVTDGFAGLVASLHRFDLVTLKTFLVRGRVFAIAVRTDGFAGLVASTHRFDLVTLETFLVRGRVPVMSHLVAVRTDGFAGLTIFVDGSALSADITSTLHGYTSFRFFDFGKSKFRSSDLTSYPTLLSARRQAHVVDTNNGYRNLPSRY